MNSFNEASMTDVEFMQLAKKRVKLKKGFKGFLITYAQVNIFLVIIYFIGSGGYFWPMWPILGWGLGIAFHGIAVCFSLSYTSSSDKVVDEYKRLKYAAESTVDYRKQEQNPYKN